MASLRAEFKETGAAISAPGCDEEVTQQLQRLADGDTAAFWRIWETSCQTVFWHYCLMWMGGHYEDAEDAMSTAAMRAYKYLPVHAAHMTNHRAWLKRLLYNHCMARRRAEQSRQRYIQYVAEPDVVAHASVAHTEPSAEESVLEDELKAHVRTLIEALPNRLSEPLSLYFFQGMQQREIAACLNLSYDNVRKRLQQGRDILRGQLAEYLSGENDAA